MTRFCQTQSVGFVRCVGDQFYKNPNENLQFLMSPILYKENFECNFSQKSEISQSDFKQSDWLLKKFQPIRLLKNDHGIILNSKMLYKIRPRISLVQTSRKEQRLMRWRAAGRCVSAEQKQKIFVSPPSSDRKFSISAETQGGCYTV